MLFRKKLEDWYVPLVPDIANPIALLTEAEARQFFAWHMQNLPGRVGYLCRLCKLPPYTDSATYRWHTAHLLKIWKWFLRVAQIEGDPETGRKRFSVATEYVLRDIGMYFGEMCVSTLPGLKWDYYTKPKSDAFVNEPVISGFVDHSFEPLVPFSCEPVNLVRVKALNLLDGTQRSTDLYDLFWHWAENTVNERPN